jgi:DNA repair photolyase
MTEGQIRDRLRAPTFRHPALIDAIATLRSRGADVTVVSPPHIERIGDAAAAQIIGSLLGSTAQRVVLRAAHVDNAVHVTLRQDDLVHTIHARELQYLPAPEDRHVGRNPA